MRRLTFVTIGARDLASLCGFSAAWGWPERPGGTDTFVSFDAGGVRLALFPLDLLGAEAAPGEAAPAPGWNGVTLAVNLATRAEVDAELPLALAAGASEVAAAVDREWGGCSGYVADPEGNRWEIAWAPS